MSQKDSGKGKYSQWIFMEYYGRVATYSGQKFAFPACRSSAKTTIYGPTECLIYLPGILISIFKVEDVRGCMNLLGEKETLSKDQKKGFYILFWKNGWSVSVCTLSSHITVGGRMTLLLSLFGD